MTGDPIGWIALGVSLVVAARQVWLETRARKIRGMARQGLTGEGPVIPLDASGPMAFYILPPEGDDAH